MSTPSYLGEPRLVRLGKFLEEIKAGELYVPRFQRPFVWTDEQRLALLQSVYLGYPIGSVMVWRTQKWKLQTYEGLGPVRLPVQSADVAAVQQYLLDGHQRMTTLFASLGPGLYDESELEEAWDNESDGPRWPIYFDLRDEDPTSNPFRLGRRRRDEGVSDTWLSLSILLDSFALGEFKDQLRKAGGKRELVNRVQAIADTMRDYTIPVVPMATEELEQVTTGFKRVNSGGSKMSEVHMVNALTWSAKFDLLERLDDVQRSLAVAGWASFDQQMIMNVCKAHFGLDIYKASAEELARGLKQEPDVLIKAQRAVLEAARVLSEIAGVGGPAALPYSYQAVLLADALWDRPALNDTVEGELRKWFWLTTLTEYFQSMTGSLFRRAKLHLNELVAGTAQATRPPELSETIEPLVRFDFKSARSRAIALLLAELNPQSPQQGAAFDAKRHLAEHGNEALIRLIGTDELPRERRNYAAGPENRFLLPAREGASFRRALMVPGEQSAALAKSHGVSPEALAKLQAADLHGFLFHRQATLWELEEARAREVGLYYFSDLHF